MKVQNNNINNSINSNIELYNNQSTSTAKKTKVSFGGTLRSIKKGVGTLGKGVEKLGKNINKISSTIQNLTKVGENIITKLDAVRVSKVDDPAIKQSIYNDQVQIKSHLKLIASLAELVSFAGKEMEKIGHNVSHVADKKNDIS